VLLALSALVVAAPASPGHAQSPAPTPDPNTVVTVNFVYAAQLGFGGYSLDGLTASVYTLPVPFTFANVADTGCDLRLRIPVQYARFTFDDRYQGERITAEDNVIAIPPLLELTIPVRPWWHIKPFAQWGPGVNLNDDDWGYIYSGGVRQLFEARWRGFLFGFGQALFAAGNDAFTGGAAEVYGVFEAGVEARHPLGFRLWTLEPDVGPYFVFYHFMPDVTLSRFLNDPLDLENQYEIGFSFGSVTPITLAGFTVEQRIGGSYQFGDGLEAWRLNFGFPF